MKKILSFVVIAAIAAATATANKSFSNSDAIVYSVSGSNVYHTNVHNARAHALCVDRDTCKVLMQLESGCKKANMHKCVLCDTFK